MAITAAVVIGGSEIAAGAAGAAALIGGEITVASIAGGLAVVGGVASVVGAATGNQNLSKIGGIVGAVGSLGVSATGLIDSMTAPAASATGVVSPAASTTDAISTGTAAATSDTAAAQTAATSANDALGVGANPAGANSPLQGPASSMSASAPPVDPTAGYTAAAPNPVAGTGLPGATPSDSLAAGVNGVGDSTVAPTANSVMPGITSTGAPTGAGGSNGLLQSAQTPPTASDLQLPTSQVSAAQNTLSQTPGSSDSLWSQFKALPLKDQLAAMQVGSGVVGGIANYIAPSPLQKAQIAEANANTAREQQAIALTNQRNANIAKQQPFFQPGAVNGAPPQAAPSPALSTSPANPYSMNNNPYANPGLLGSAGAPVGATQ